jgi:hypothetical protein
MMEARPKAGTRPPVEFTAEQTGALPPCNFAATTAPTVANVAGSHVAPYLHP